MKRWPLKRKVLENSVDETSFLDQTVSRSGSFLDRLISEMKSARESKSDDLDFDHDLQYENQEIEENENLEGLLFFQQLDKQESNKSESNLDQNHIPGVKIFEELELTSEETGKSRTQCIK